MLLLKLFLMLLLMLLLPLLSFLLLSFPRDPVTVPPLPQDPLL